MELKKLEYDFSVCKVTDLSGVDITQDFCFIGKTDEELSLVCITDNVPDNVGVFIKYDSRKYGRTIISFFESSFSFASSLTRFCARL